MTRAPYLSPDEQTFDREVLERDGTTLVEFWAPWCGPCRAVKPIVEMVAAERDGTGLRVAFVNVDDAPRLAERFGIRSIPAMKLFRGGRVVGERQGAATKAQLDDWIDAHAA